MTKRAGSETTPRNLRTASISVRGDWDGIALPTVQKICKYVRDACFSGIELHSDNQPHSIAIRNEAAGNPAIWLHSDKPRTAEIVVVVGQAAWSQLAYQLGHELGHVLCNSWTMDAKPALPSQWIEESLAEAFSIANLGVLAQFWQSRPPFRGDQDYASSLLDYRDNLINQIETRSASLAELPKWFRRRRGHMSPYYKGLRKFNDGLLRLLVSAFDDDRAMMGDMGALNRWPGRSALPTDEYLDAWSHSCKEIGAAGTVPALIRRTI
jgi:hypothetical protein